MRCSAHAPAAYRTAIWLAQPAIADTAVLGRFLAAVSTVRQETHLSSPNRYVDENYPAILARDIQSGSPER